MAERKPISKKTRFEVFKRDKFTCQYCGRTVPDVVLHVDHIFPVAEGGTNDITNLITACADCNLGKGARLLSDDSESEIKRRQLEAMRERREQLRMMHEWEECQIALLEGEITAIEDIFKKRYIGTYLSADGRTDVAKLIDRFTFNVVKEAATRVCGHYDSADRAFGKLGGTCFNMVNKSCSQCVKHEAIHDDKWHVKCNLGATVWKVDVSVANSCADYEPWWSK